MKVRRHDTRTVGSDSFCTAGKMNTTPCTKNQLWIKQIVVGLNFKETTGCQGKKTSNFPTLAFRHRSKYKPNHIRSCPGLFAAQF